MALLDPTTPDRFGDQLRAWRTHRRFSQLELAGRAEVSTRHLSFLENGRSKPSREMVLHLAEVLDVPLAARNDLLTGAGLSPEFPHRGLDDSAMHEVRDVVATVLAGHRPNPAIVVDRHWDLVDANEPAMMLMAGVDAALLEPPINVVRLSLHPDGMARTVVNFAEYAAHLLWRLRRQVERTADPVLAGLLAEAEVWVPEVEVHRGAPSSPAVVLPLQVRVDGEVLSFFSTIAVFGAPRDITLDELALESFFPADARTAEVLAARARG